MSFISLLARTVEALTRIPTPARVSCLLYFVSALADGALTPFFALWAVKVAHVEIAWIGVLLGCYAGGELLATPFIGGLADRIGRRPVLLISTAGVGLGFLLLLIARGPFAAAACLIVIGVFESVLHPTAATVIADVADHNDLTDSFAQMRFCGNAGRMLGPAIGAAFAVVSLQLVFVGAAAALLLGAVCVAIFLRETRPARVRAGDGRADDDDDEESLTALAAVIRDGRLAALLLPVAAFGICASWTDAVVPLYANNFGLLSEAGVGFLFTYVGALGVVLQLPISAYAKQHPAQRLVVAIALLHIVAFAVLLAPPDLTLLVGAVTLLALAQMLLGPWSNVLAVKMAPVHARATYQAAFGITNDLRGALGPAIGTALYAVAARLPWLAAVMVSTAASVILALAIRHSVRARGQSD